MEVKKTYSFGRKIQRANYIKGAKQYESAEFIVNGASSPEEAEKLTDEWAKDYIKRKTKEINDKRTNEEKFNDSLDDSPPKRTLTKEEDQEQNGLPKKGQ